MSIPSVVFIPQPFANNADPQYINTIPDTSVDPGAATYDEGFPPRTMQEEVSGGRPPLGQDFNGILNALSTHVFAQQAGQLYRYSSAASTAIGGYPIGTMLESSDGVTVWFNTTDANTGDPDANAAGWVPMFNYGYTTKAGLTGGVVTLTRLEARSGVIVLTGVLVANLQLVFPNTLQTWLVVNATTGSFTTTARTAAGSGVTIPQGGYPSPIGVYGNGVNLYPTIAPLGTPIDQAATPLTLAQRTNNGYLLATYFNQSSPLESLTIGAVFVQQSSPADGYLRKISLVNFRVQLFLNAALTGAPTAPTAAVGTSDVQIATTEYAKASSVGGTGTSWQDFTVGVTRDYDTPYTNSTGRPIEVVVSAQAAVGGFTFQPVVDGVGIAAVSMPTTGMITPCTFTVPDGSVYSIQALAGSADVTGWRELR